MQTDKIPSCKTAAQQQVMQCALCDVTKGHWMDMLWDSILVYFPTVVYAIGLNNSYLYYMYI